MVTLPDLLDGELAEITVEDFTVSLHKMMFGMAKTLFCMSSSTSSEVEPRLTIAVTSLQYWII